MLTVLAVTVSLSSWISPYRFALDTSLLSLVAFGTMIRFCHLLPDHRLDGV